MLLQIPRPITRVTAQAVRSLVAQVASSLVAQAARSLVAQVARSLVANAHKSDSDADVASDTEDHDRLNSPIHKKNDSSQSFESTDVEDDNKNFNEESFETLDIQNALQVQSGLETGPNSNLTSENVSSLANFGRDRSESKKSDHGAQNDFYPPATSAPPPLAATNVMFRDRAGSVISRERAASTCVLVERKHRSSALFKKIVAIEKKESFKELVKQVDSLLQNVVAAGEAKMEAGVLGELTSVLAFAEGSLEKQRAIYRQGNIHTIIQGILMEMGKSAKISERCMLVASGSGVLSFVRMTTTRALSATNSRVLSVWLIAIRFQLWEGSSRSSLRSRPMQRISQWWQVSAMQCVLCAVLKVIGLN